MAIKMKKFVLFGIFFSLVIIPFVASAQSSNSIAGFEFGSTEDEVALLLKDLKDKGVCQTLSSGYDFFSKKLRMSCRSEAMTANILSLRFKSITLEFNSKNNRLTDIEFGFGFPDRSTQVNNFDILVKDIEKVAGKKVVISVEEDKVGNKTRIVRVKGSAFNITLKDDNTFGSRIIFWKD